MGYMQVNGGIFLSENIILQGSFFIGSASEEEMLQKKGLICPAALL